MDNPAQFDITNIDKTWCPGWELQSNSMTVEVLKHPEFPGLVKTTSFQQMHFVIRKDTIGLLY